MNDWRSEESSRQVVSNGLLFIPTFTLTCTPGCFLDVPFAAFQRVHPAKQACCWIDPWRQRSFRVSHTISYLSFRPGEQGGRAPDHSKAGRRAEAATPSGQGTVGHPPHPTQPGRCLDTRASSDSVAASAPHRPTNTAGRKTFCRHHTHTHTHTHTSEGSKVGTQTNYGKVGTSSTSLQTIHRLLGLKILAQDGFLIMIATILFLYLQGVIVNTLQQSGDQEV